MIFQSQLTIDNLLDLLANPSKLSGSDKSGGMASLRIVAFDNLAPMIW